MNKLSYLEAVQKILSAVRSSQADYVKIEAAAGLVLAEDVRAVASMPGALTAGPDGYALRASDIRGASKEKPAVLSVVGTARAGRPFGKKILPGTAVRIMTGSVLPDGADCVIRFEDTDEPAIKSGPNPKQPSKVKIYVSEGVNTIRPIGNNAMKGQTVIKKGTVLYPMQAAVLSGIGLAKVKAYRRPVAAVITTGDELASPGKALPFGKVYNMNQTSITESLKAWGAEPKLMGIAPDSESGIREKIEKALSLNPDLIITSGGVSLGDYDFMRLILSKIGKILFARIALAPGAAVAFALVKDISGKERPFFALSGPPAGCIVNLETLVRPAVFKMLGYEKTSHPSVKAISSGAIKSMAPMSLVKWVHVREENGKHYAETDLGDNPFGFSCLAAANGFIIMPPGCDLKEGDEVEVYTLN